MKVQFDVAHVHGTFIDPRKESVEYRIDTSGYDVISNYTYGVISYGQKIVIGATATEEEAQKALEKFFKGE